MKRVKRRTFCLLILVAVLFSGLGLYVFKYSRDGEDWVSFASNQTVYTDGQLAVGTINDRNGVYLAGISDDVRSYSEDSMLREATLHAVGDKLGNIGTGALSVFSSELIGYNPITGAYSVSGDGAKLNLSIDADLNLAAYHAMGSYSGTVGIVNYDTGEVFCMYSSPSYDPENVPEDIDTNSAYEGAYMNRFLQAAYTPGSIYKLVTLAAAIENVPDLYERIWTCTGSMTAGTGTITCTREHGNIMIEDALAVSCNCAFAQLALELGGNTIANYAEKYGLTTELEIDGISTAAGNYDIAEAGSDALAWSGVGQYNDTVCPASFLRFVSAIANGGAAVDFTLLKSGKTSSEVIMSDDLSNALASMMNYNVYQTYGTENYPGLSLYAKSGTAEVGADSEPHAWFAGFIDNEDYPLAFIVIVENGGWGSATAGSIANTVLQAAITK